MSQEPSNSDCSFFQLSVHNNIPAFDIGSVWVTAYILPWIITMCLLLAAAPRNQALRHEKLQRENSGKIERAGLPALPDKPYTSPNIFWELLRISAFLGPMAAFTCLVAVCNSCLPWWPVIAGGEAKPPFSVVGSYLGTLMFLLCWCHDGYPKDEMRPYRSPMDTLRNEVWACARSAGRALLVLHVLWGFAWVMWQLGLSLG